MPPKTRKEHREDEELESVASDSGSSTTTSASSIATLTLSAEQLQLMLDSNTKNMMSFVESKLASSSGASSSKIKIEIPKWKEGDSPSEFLGKYEQALIHNGVGRGEWGRLLRVYLSDSDQAAYLLINPDRLGDYDFVRSELLESLGDTPDGADKRWVTLHRNQGESSRALFRRVHATGYRRMEGLSSKEECCNRMILSKFLSLLGPECYSSVVGKRPRNGHEAARFAQEYEEEVLFARSLKSWSLDGSDSSDGGMIGRSGPQGQSSDGNQDVKTTGRQNSDRHPVTCFGCGEPGHIRPNCPHKVRQVVVQGSKSGFSVDGFLAGFEVKGLRIDTGSDRTLVHQDFIPKAAFLGKSIMLDSWRGGQVSRHRLARIPIRIGEQEVMAEVAVVDKLNCPALIGLDLGPDMTKLILGLISKQASTLLDVVVKKVESVRQVSSVIVEVPMQQEEDLVKEAEEEDAPIVVQTADDPLPFSDIFDFSDDLFVDDSLPGEDLESMVEVEQKCEVGEVLENIVEVEREIVIDQAGSDDDISLVMDDKEDGVDFLCNERFLFYYARATRGLAPIGSAFSTFMSLLFFNVVLWIMFLLVFSVFAAEFFSKLVVGFIKDLLLMTRIGGALSPWVFDNIRGGRCYGLPSPTQNSITYWNITCH